MALERWFWAARVPHNSGAPGREVGAEGHWGSLCREVFSPGAQGAGRTGAGGGLGGEEGGSCTCAHGTHALADTRLLGAGAYARARAHTHT